MKSLVAATVILVALATGAPVQAQTPEIDALRARAEAGVYVVKSIRTIESVS